VRRQPHRLTAQRLAHGVLDSVDVSICDPTAVIADSAIAAWLVPKTSATDRHDTPSVHFGLPVGLRVACAGRDGSSRPSDRGTG